MEEDLFLPHHDINVTLDAKKHVPAEMHKLLHDIYYEVLRHQPQDIVPFIAKILQEKVDKRNLDEEKAKDQ